MARRGRSSGPKRKKLSYELVKRDSPDGQMVYAMLDELVEKHHEEILHARIAVAWNRAWKPDVDGHVKLGKLKKASDLDRELVDFDFVVMLSRSFWLELGVTDEQRRALLDHELCHASVKLDKYGEPALDEKERVVYRTRKHDIEEFAAIVERHGCYKRDLARFASALRRSKVKQADLPLDPPLAAGKPPLPSEPHPFMATAKGEECGTCGSGKADPVHVTRTVPVTGQTAANVQRILDEPSPGNGARSHARKRAKRPKRGPIARRREART